MTHSPGYLLPDGECYTDEMACTLVFYPDKQEYRRALLGSIVYLSNWLAWERDSEKRGKDAARAWKNAVEQTLECWTMTCFEELMADVARIRTLMETKKDCCDDNVTYYPTEQPITEIEPEVGDPPEFYGETAVADWDEWLEHVCYNAHKYVDYLKDTASQLQEAVGVNSIYMGLIAAALAVLSFSGIGLPIAFGLAALVVTGVALSATVLTFGDTADDFEDARQSIVCALYTGQSLANAVETALSSGTDWDLFYQWIDYEAATAIIYEGGWNDEYLPTEKRSDCDCESFGHFEFTFDADADGFVPPPLPSYTPNHIFISPSSSAQWQAGRWWTWDALETRFSLSLPITVDQLKVNIWLNGSYPAQRFLWQFRIYGTSETVQISPEYDSDDFADNEWVEQVWNFDTPIISGDTEKAIYIRVYRFINQSGSWIGFDDLGVYLRP